MFSKVSSISANNYLPSLFKSLNTFFFRDFFIQNHASHRGQGFSLHNHATLQVPL